MSSEEIKAILDELTDKELKELHFFLSKHGIPKNRLEKAETTYALTDLLVQHFSWRASEVLEDILQKSNHKNLADQVRNWKATTEFPGKRNLSGTEAVEWKGSNNDSKPEATIGRLNLNKHNQDCYDLSQIRVAFMMCLKESRPGAEKDIDIMKKWFDKFKFETPLEECIDPLGKDIIPKLKAFRDKINQSSVEISCCLVVLMCHGNCRGCIVGRDKGEANIGEILDLFNNKQCPKLQQKPKIFIIQACRGRKCDTGVEADDEAMESDDVPKQKLPTASDYFIVYSSQKGYFSYRDPETGSIMITAMDEVLSERGREWHVGDLFTKVNSLMVQKEMYLKGEKDTVKVTLVMESTLTKAIYLA